MQNLNKGVLLAAMALAGAVQAAEPQELKAPGAVEAVVKKAYSGKAELDMVARGDLNGDGIEDWALRVTYPTTEDDRSRERVLVLFARKDGSVFLAARSNETEEPMRGSAIGDIQIKHGSLYLQSGGATCCEAESDVEQFKFRDGAFVRIGMTARSFSTDDTNKDVTEDTNLLTGDKIVTDKSGKKAKVSKTKVPKEKLVKLDEWPG